MATTEKILANEAAFARALVKANPDHPHTRFTIDKAEAFEDAVRRLAPDQAGELLNRAVRKKNRDRKVHEERVAEGVARQHAGEVLVRIRALVADVDDHLAPCTVAEVRDVVEAWFAAPAKARR